MKPVSLADLQLIPQDKLLYDEIVYDRVNRKLKKLRVRIKQASTTDGSKVFNLDIKGLRHKFHLQLSFTPQDLCFLLFEDIRENNDESSCFACLDSNYQMSHIFSRLTFVLYSCASEGEEAKCIKVPLLQKGYTFDAAALRKLQYTIHTFIADQDDLKHWWLQVVSSSNIRQGEYAYLCVTRYAVIVMQRFQILEHHAFHNSDVRVSTMPSRKEIQITLSKRMTSGSPDGFMLMSQYTFKTRDWQNIEHAIKVAQQSQQDSQLLHPSPTAHFNILHSEISASAIIPGTTSDNIAIMPSYHENNNTGSSGSAGYLSHKLTNVASFNGSPRPHFVPQNNSSSNGHIPNMETGQIKEDEVHVRLSDVIRPRNIPLLPELLVYEYHMNSPERHYPEKPGTGTDPSPKVPDKTFRLSLADMDCFDNIDLMPENGDMRDSAVGSFPAVLETEEENIPPPTPCSSLPHPHGEIFIKKPAPCLPAPEEPVLPPKHKLLRSQSFLQLTDTELLAHDYINIEYSHLLRRNVHDDSPYFRFYYNFGFVRMASIGKKLSRRQRFSKELPAVDFNKLGNHEQWFDQGYKYRDKDLRFCRLSRMNIEKEEKKVDFIYSEPKQEPPPDDPYWSSSLSLTIQKMLQENPKDTTMSDEIQSAFDLSHEQLATIQVLLSLVPSERNWRNLAEYIGLDSGDISIIEHYCYTYRELAARVVLYHWLLECRQGKQDKESSWENLHEFVDEIERNDIKNVMSTERQNENIQIQRDLQRLWHGGVGDASSNVRGELASLESRQGLESEEKETLVVDEDEVTYL